MEVADSDIKQQKLANSVQKEETPSKFYNHFMYKAVIVLIFLVILPLFPSQAPEFINQTIVTRSWELLHLIFVGIAVSYGLFCHENDVEKENNNSKFDNAQSYVTGFLQVSSIFEDEVESPTTESNEKKVQTWSHQYHRNDPVIVMAQHHNERRATSSNIEGKPLFLPIRSLKYRVSDPGVAETTGESSPSSGSITRPNSKRFHVNPNKVTDGVLGAKDSTENIVLPSPIPWRSRSGRMKMKNEVEVSSPNSIPLSSDETELGKHESKYFSKSQTFSSSRTKSPSPSPTQSSPRKLSPLPSFSSETQAKTEEDLRGKKSFRKSPSTPIPLPPPPPPMIRKTSSIKPNSANEEVMYEKELGRSSTSEKKDSNWSNGDILLSGVDAVIEAKARNHVEGPFMGKSVRTIRNMTTLTNSGENKSTEKRDSHFQRSYIEKPPRMGTNYDEQTSFSVPSGKDQSIVEEIREEEHEDYVDKVVVESDVDTESEDGGDDDFVGSFTQNDVETSHPENDENSNNAETDSISDVLDVDKKADEFIAKFREQIRLQRIDSIKRFSAQIKRNTSR